MKDDHILGWDSNEIFHRFSKKMQKKKKIKLPAVTQENGSCNENTQFKIVDRRRKDPAMVLSKIKVSGTSDFNCTQDSVKIDSLHFYDQISLQMT